MPSKQARSIRSTAIASACAAAIAGFLPAGCSDGPPPVEGITPPQCTPAGGQRPCPSGQACVGGVCQEPATGGAGGTTGTGGSGPGGTGTAGTIIVPPPDGGGEDGGLDPDATCGAESQDAEIVPVSMLVMFDRSGSMSQLQDAMDAASPSRWTMASAALKSFFSTAEDLAVALRFFPHDVPVAGCIGGSTNTCDAVACSQPLVPLMADPMMLLPKLEAAPGDAHETALLAAIDMSTPPASMSAEGMAAGTPTHAALDGALQWASAYQMAHPRPEQQTLVILVTDGEPSGCDQDINNIAQLAAGALASSGVATYTIGLTGSNENDMRTIAMAGGGESFFVSDGANATADLIAAFEAIKGSALGCEFSLPAGQGGATDPNKVNVDYTPGPSAMIEPFGKVASLAECGADYAWYYDDPAMPTQIILCPATCEVVRVNPTAGISIAIGCESRPPVPR